MLLGFRYWTDANTGGFGFMVDDINITGFPTDGAETDAGWTYKPTTGFHVTTGTEIGAVQPLLRRRVPHSTGATTAPSRSARTSSAT